jgi:predicted O-methyltransferase YrrM
MMDKQNVMWIEKNLKIPIGTSTPIRLDEGYFLYNFIKTHKITETLEIGLGYARSASYIMAATKKKHFAIDPFQKNYNFGGIRNIKRCGFARLFHHIAKPSAFALLELIRKKKTFEFIFIDGDHKFDGIFVDFFFSDFLIKQNGFILLHDSWMRSTQIVTRFVKTNRKDYVQIKSPEKNIIIFQKNGLDARDGMHFKEFFSFKKIISYNMREALNRNPELKKIIKKIKT